MGFREFGYLLLGIIIFFALRFITSSIASKTPIAKTAKTRGFVLFACDLILVAGGLAIALYALNITAGGKTMSPSELTLLTAAVNEYFTLVWVLAGIALGALMLFIAEMIVAFINRDKELSWIDKEAIRYTAYGIWQQRGNPQEDYTDYWSEAQAIWKKSKRK